MNPLMEALTASDDPLAPTLREQLVAIEQFARSMLHGVPKAASSERFHQPVEHAIAVAELCGELLPQHRLAPRDARALNIVEITVLLAATWLHEVGLSDSETLQYYNLLSARKIWDPELGRSLVPGLDLDLAPAIADLVRGHRDHHRGHDLTLTLRDLKRCLWRNRAINVPALAALFRTAFRLEVQQRRQPSDLGAQVPANESQAWVESCGIAALVIAPERGVVRVELSPIALGSEASRAAIARWIQQINREFVNETMPLLATFELAYRGDLVTLPTERPQDGARERFSQDARRVVGMAAVLGAWECGLMGDGWPLLRRTLVDGRGTTVSLKIAPTANYPRQAPQVIAIPRPIDMHFSDLGEYDYGDSIIGWQRLDEDDRLIALCDELRRFESPSKTFEIQARTARLQHPAWTLDTTAGAVCLRRAILDGELRLSPRTSYPLQPPEVHLEPPGSDSFVASLRVFVRDRWSMAPDALSRVLTAVETSLKSLANSEST